MRNGQEPLVGRARSAARGADCAWCGQCARCAEPTVDQLEIVEDRPDGQFIQILECGRCRAARACRPEWTTRCHICMDERTSAKNIEGWLELYRTIGPDSDLTTDQVESEVREYAASACWSPSRTETGPSTPWPFWSPRSSSDGSRRAGRS